MFSRFLPRTLLRTLLRTLPRTLLFFGLLSALSWPVLAQVASASGPTFESGKGKKGDPPRPKPKPGPREGGDDD